MKIKKDEWMWFDTENKWTMKIEDEKNNYYSDIYSPGQTKQRLKIGREVEWSTWWSKMLIFSRLASTWTWSQSFTWFWFKPTSYSILAVRQGITLTNAPCYSDWWYDWINQWYMQIADWYSRADDTTAVLRVFYTNQWWWQTKASHTSFDIDGITLNFTSSQEDIKLFITCYS